MIMVNGTDVGCDVCRMYASRLKKCLYLAEISCREMHAFDRPRETVVPLTGSPRTDKCTEWRLCAARLLTASSMTKC